MNAWVGGGDTLYLPYKRIDKFMFSILKSTQMGMELQKMSRGHAKCDNGTETDPKRIVYNKLYQQLAVLLSQKETTVNRIILITGFELQKVGERKIAMQNIPYFVCHYKLCVPPIPLHHYSDNGLGKKFLSYIVSYLFFLIYR